MSNLLNGLVKKAEVLLRQKKIVESLDVYKKICSLERNNPNAWINYGTIAGNLGKLDIAETAFKKAYKLQNNAGSAADALAQVYELKGKYDSAINTLIIQHKKNPNNHNLKIKIAINYSKLENYNKAIQWLNEYIKLHPDSSYAHSFLAISYEQMGNKEEAEHHYKKTLEFEPGSFQAHNSYGVFLQKSGKFDQALVYYLKSIDLNKEYLIGYYNTALLLHLKGEYKSAIKYYNDALELDPNNTAVLVGLGKSYHYASETDAGIQLYNKAISIDNNCCDAYANLGIAHVKYGRFDEGMKAYEKALEIEPENIEIICAISTLYERKGDFNNAHNLLKGIMNDHIDDYNFALAYGKLSRKIDDRNNAINILNSAANKLTTPPLIKSEIHFLIGKLFDDQHEYDKAFMHYKSANGLQPFVYNHDKNIEYKKEIISTYSKSFMETMHRADNDKTPIFIVGMPRSGTTLVEQILSSHPDVYGGGELTYISDLQNNIVEVIQTNKKPPACILDCDKSTLNKFSKEYIDLTRQPSPDIKYITDKMPHNFQLLGFIELLFPEAKIIHCTRNPIDTCLSIYFNSFNANHAYSRDLDQLGTYYKEYYLEIMAHWRKTLKTQILEINYETLIANQESVSREIIDYCKLDWDDACLRFYETKRNVETISYDQVRQPIYHQSCERWRNYEKDIKPLIKHFHEYI